MVSVTSVSLGVGLAGSAKLAWGASKVTPWLITKCIAVGMTATLATFVGAEQLQRAFDTSHASMAEPMPAPSHLVLGQPASAASATPSAPAAEAASPALPTRAPTASPSTVAAPLEAATPQASDHNLPSSTAFEAGGAAASSAALAREVARLQRVRASLATGAPSAALQSLDGYALEFPAGALRAEAAALRIEAVARLGNVTLVRRLASEFLTRFPASPLVERVRAVSGTVDAGVSKP
jgi:hypothetical protein